MAKNEEGEFELILGNRQLISVFLIVVILLGVFFSMGYIVGRNSAPVTAAENARANKAFTEPAAEPAQASPPSQPASSAPASKPSEETKTSPLASTHPEQPAPSATPAGPPAEPPKLKPAPVVARPSVPTDPAPGDYWQVVATARPDAEIISEALVKKGFHAVVAPAPKDGVFRVLVGPLRDAATQAQTRTQLEAAGFKNPLIRKY